MKCIGVIDKLPVLSGHGATILVNGLDGFVFHHVEVGHRAWAGFDGRGEASEMRADGEKFCGVYSLMGLVRAGGAG